MISISNKKYAVVKDINIHNKDIIITQNGNYYAEEPYTGLGVVRVQIPEPIYEEIIINPSINMQEILPQNDGISKVTVNPVTYLIDENIKAENILKGISILGIEGNVEFITEDIIINPSTNTRTFTPINDGFHTVIINAVTNEIDENIKSNNIKKGVNILGIQGNVIEVNNTTRDITSNGLYKVDEPYTGFSEVNVNVQIEQDQLDINPSTEEQIFTAIDGYHGFSPVIVNPVTSSIDNNIKPENIKKGVTILDVDGNCEEINTTTEYITSNGIYTPQSPYNGFSSIEVDVNTVNNTDIIINSNGVYTPPNPYTGFERVEVDINTVNNTNITIHPSINEQIITPENPYTGFETITVNPVTSAIDNNIQPSNIKKNITILGITGTYEEPLQNKTFVFNSNSSTITTIYPDSSYSGLSSVTIDLSYIENYLENLNAGDTATVVNLQNKTINGPGIYTCDSGYDGLGIVTVSNDWIQQLIDDNKYPTVSGDLDAVLDNTATYISSDATYIRNYAFYQSNITEVTLNCATSIGTYAFAQSSLNILRLTGNTLCSLGNNALPSSIAHIYVPNSLLNAYKTATNWSNYSSIIQVE